MKYLCIHGHFYQPPRENAWLETIELQKEAAPFHDWNERINFECYAPNASARILNPGNYISRITNNYARISFNFGPTLLRWLEKADEPTYQGILKADAESSLAFGGHGSAMAQVYSHLIMPLADREDKITQVKWGISDFEHRFGRKPEGMWLAETAVDTDTLEVLAEAGIRFTILAPRQAKAIRTAGEKWLKVSEATLDTRRPYRCQLPSGKHIALFFYNGEISQEVAFKGLLNNGIHFAERLLGSFSESDEPQLVHIATDGESYGHHHRFGEMALANALRHIEDQPDVKITNYGEFLDLFPPTWEAQIHEQSSWSCAHGVERWRSDCGCNTGKMGWHQKWREPLRNALDWLRDELRMRYVAGIKEWGQDPWEVRNAYINVVLDRSETRLNEFFQSFFPALGTKKERTAVLRLMEMQRFAVLMYTSCGWFFDEISGIETIQILQYAVRAIAFVKTDERKDLLDQFLEEMAKAPGNVYKDGSLLMHEKVLPSEVNLERVAMHFASASLFEEQLDDLKRFNYQVKSRNFSKIRQGHFRIASGCATIESLVTGTQKEFCFAVLYLGQQQIFGSVSLNFSEAEFPSLQHAVNQAFRETHLTRVLQLMQEHFGACNFSFAQLFLDEKHRVLKELAAQSMEQADTEFQKLVNDNYQLLTEMRHNQIPLPETFKSVLQHVLNRDLHHFIESNQLHIPTLRHIVEEFRKWEVSLIDLEAFRLRAGERIFREIDQGKNISKPDLRLEKIAIMIEVLEDMGLELDLWKAQNAFLSLRTAWSPKENLPENFERAIHKLAAVLRIEDAVG